MSYDWSRFKVRIPINTSVDEMYRRWSSSKGLTSWFLREAVFFSNEGVQRNADESVRPGDSYLWRWHGYGDETQEKGTILSANHSDELSFVFGEAGKVLVKIYPEKGFTICDLEQYDIPTDDHGRHSYHVGCSTGWTFHLTNFKSMLEGGADLRNKDVELKQVINS